MLFAEQYPYFFQRRSRDSGYRRPCRSRVLWSANRVGRLPGFLLSVVWVSGLRSVRSCGGRHGLVSRLGLLGLFVFSFLL